MHANATLDGLDRVLQAWKPPLVVVLDHSDVWRSVKAESPHTLLVGRLVLAGEPDFNEPALDPLAAARSHCDAVLPLAERMGKTYDYWQGTNEPVVGSAEAMQRLAEFETERARIMSGHGFRVVVGSFGAGNPPHMAWWQQFLPALEAARQFNGALALHEYAWPTLDHESPWYLLRHRKVYGGEPKQNWAGLPTHLRGAPLLITECGLDGMLVLPRPQGWKTLYAQDAGHYLRQLAWYDAELQKDPYVVGAALYCCCTADDPQWASYNIWPELAQALAQDAHPLYRPVEFPKPAPPERPKPAALPKQRAPLPTAASPAAQPVPSLPVVPPPSPPGAPVEDRLDEVLQRLDRILALLAARGGRG